MQFCSLGGGLPEDINGNSFLCNTRAYCRYLNRKTTHASSFFSSRGGAGPLAWPRGSNAGPENKIQFIQQCNIWEPFFSKKIFSKWHLLCYNKWWQKNITMWQSKSPLKNNSHQINYSFAFGTTNSPRVEELYPAALTAVMGRAAPAWVYEGYKKLHVMHH